MFVRLVYNLQSQIHSHVQDVGVQCSLTAPVRHSNSVFPPYYASSPLPPDASQSESETSQGDFEIPDLDTSGYIMQDIVITSNVFYALLLVLHL